VRSLGYLGREVIEGGYSYILSGADGRRLVLHCFGRKSDQVCSSSDEVSLLRFCAMWGGMENYSETQVSKLCHSFNQDQPFSKLYKSIYSQESVLILEADLYVLDGMAEKSFHEKFELFVRQMNIVARNLNNCIFADKLEILERHDKAIKLFHSLDGNTDEAVQLYRLNSINGFAGSQNNLGDLFEKGEFVPKDDLLAMYWYTCASERGEPTAYLSLASILEQSRENTDALIIAAKYAILACRFLPEGRNMLSATEIKNNLKKILSEELFELAEYLANGFRPLYEERFVLSDSPGPKISIAPGSDLLN
jgi:hypothetical protein